VIADRDPFVAQALDLLVPEIDFDPDTLLSGAHARAASMLGARRRQLTVVAIAFAVLLLLAGGAFAADKAGLLPFLHTNDKNSARFSVNPRGEYDGAAPLALACPRAGKRAFACNATGLMAPGNRNYQLGMRVDKVPSLTRAGLNASLDKGAANGADPAQVARARSDLAAVGDDFLRALAVLSRVETVSGSSGPSADGTERVPPRGVPAWAACRELTLTTFRCRPLAALVGVKSGTPLYFLQQSKDWRTVQAPPQEQSDFTQQLERLLGRKPNAEEIRFFVDLSTVGSATSSGSGSSGLKKGTPTAVSDPRGTALLGPRNLGLRARHVSAVARPLPRHLPGGLARSANTRLYRVTFDRHTIFVYVTRSHQLGVWLIAWIGSKP
jgi:hypothetical protein